MRTPSAERMRFGSKTRRVDRILFVAEHRWKPGRLPGSRAWVEPGKITLQNVGDFAKEYDASSDPSGLSRYSSSQTAEAEPPSEYQG